jgi:CheY-like chemotaxis protein
MNANAIARAIRILHVEDNPGDARLVKEMIEAADSLDYHLAQAERLEQALAVLASERRHVVLVDLAAGQRRSGDRQTNPRRRAGGAGDRHSL